MVICSNRNVDARVDFKRFENPFCSQVHARTHSVTVPPLQMVIKVSVLALLLTSIEIKNREIDLRREIEDDEVISIIVTQIKRRKEAAALFEKGGRNDLYEKENQEMIILQEYLPDQVSEESLRKRIQELIVELGVVEIKDIGKVMKKVVPEFKGRADNGQIKNLVAEYLGQ